MPKRSLRARASIENLGSNARKKPRLHASESGSDKENVRPSTPESLRIPAESPMEALDKKRQQAMKVYENFGRAMAELIQPMGGASSASSSVPFPPPVVFPSHPTSSVPAIPTPLISDLPSHSSPAAPQPAQVLQALAPELVPTPNTAHSQPDSPATPSPSPPKSKYVPPPSISEARLALADIKALLLPPRKGRGAGHFALGDDRLLTRMHMIRMFLSKYC
ncbi:hypothetical protein V8D89_007434 [Ganoderma adspersum]